MAFACLGEVWGKRLRAKGLLGLCALALALIPEFDQPSFADPVAAPTGTPKAPASSRTATALPGVGATSAGSKPPAASGLLDCSAYGAKFVALGGVFCGAIGYDVILSANKDYATTDIGMAGQRLTTANNANASVPVIYYFGQNWKDETRYPYPGLFAQVNFTAVGQTDAGPLVAFVNLQGDGQVQDVNGSWRGALNNVVPGSMLDGVVDQAWVRLGGLQAGVQPSMFGFVRSGYSFNPGYSSLLDIPAVSYTFRTDEFSGRKDSFSLSLPAEDPVGRELADGVVARYGYPRAPDLVAQGRYLQPNLLLSVSGALHPIDDATALCCSTARKTGWGEAVAAAAEMRWKWSDLIGAYGGSTYGRLMLQGAVARGALGYLGMPLFATDYVANADGSIQQSSGLSLLASYEQLLTPTLKANATFSYFSAQMGSQSSDILPNVPFSFDTKVDGRQLQVGVEKMVRPGLRVGLEASYDWTNVRGEYAGVSASPLSVAFPTLTAYVRQTF